MKNIIKFIIVASLLLLVSCTSEISIKLNKDNSVNISLSAGAGEAFTKMLMNTTGDNAIIDEKQVTYELVKAGFSDVKVKASGKSNVNITLVDRNCSSYLFTSGMFSAEKGKLGVNITPETLKDFYDSADEQTVNVLDLFLAPIFNDEKMSEKEYLEMVGTFYGENAAKEIADSVILINIENADGGKSKFHMPLAEVLCGLNSIVFN